MDALTPALVQVRRGASRRSLVALRAELRAAGVLADVPASVAGWLRGKRSRIWEPSAYRPESSVSARRLMRRLARRWRTAAEEAREELTDRAAMRRATRLMRPALETITVTESSVAFTEARLSYLDEVARLGGPLVTLRWVAESDACPRCQHLDGDEVPADEGWPSPPGAIHPNCRCYAEVVT